METIWEILPRDGDEGFSVDDWLRLIESRAELQRIAPVKCPNPFKPGEQIELSAPDTSASIVIDGKKLGSVSWAMDDSTQVNAMPNPGDEAEMYPIVESIAASLNAAIVGHHFE